MDSKKDLEKLLKATCEVFIMAVTKLTVEPMLSFITKVTAVRVASSLNSGKRLREQVSSLLPPAACTQCWSIPLLYPMCVKRPLERLSRDQVDRTTVLVEVLRCDGDCRPLPARRGWRRWL